MGFTLIGVTQIGEVKKLVELNFLNYPLPLGLPIVGDVQDMLHEIIYVHKNLMMVKFSNYNLFVVVALVSFNAFCIKFLLLPGNLWRRVNNVVAIALRGVDLRSR